MYSLIVKIIISICAVLASGYYILMSYALRMSSHNIDDSAQEHIDNQMLLVVLLSFFVLIFIWIPWRRIKR